MTFSVGGSAELENAKNLAQGRGMCTRFEALMRKWFHSTSNAFGSAARRDEGSAAGNVPVLGAGGLLVRARWAAALAASRITGRLAAARNGVLPAEKVTSGLLAEGQIPSMDAADNFDAGEFRIEQLPAGDSGAFITGSAFVPTVTTRAGGGGVVNPDGASFNRIPFMEFTACSVDFAEPVFTIRLSTRLTDPPDDSGGGGP